MKSTVESRSGFTVFESLIILVVVTVLGFAWWYVYDHQYKNSPAPASTSSRSSLQTSITPVVPAWDVTTQVPDGWKTFSSSIQKFVISYPSGWSVKTTTDKSSTIYKSDKDVKYFGAEFDAPPAGRYDVSLPYYFNVEVTNRSLRQALKDDENALVYQNQGPGAAVTPKIDGTKYYTFKGNSAVLLNTEIKDNNTGAVSYDQDLLIAANGNVYDFNAQIQGKFGPFLNVNIKAVIGSLKFQ